MRHFILWIMSLMASLLYSQSTPITVKGKQFYKNGSVYNPMVMNVRSFAVLKDENYYFAHDFTYHLEHLWEWSNAAERDAETLSDFTAINSLGFNAVRVVNLEPDYSDEFGLFLKIINHNFEPTPALQLHPDDPDDFGTNILLKMIADMLALANQINNGDFRLIYLLGLNGDLTGQGFEEYKSFIKVLAQKVPEMEYGHLLLALELMNEPCYNFDFEHPKSIVCSRIAEIYDEVKTVNPNLLIATGSCGTEDVFAFDLSFLKVDFLSVHRYPYFRDNEDRTNVLVQERAKKRVMNELFWFNQQCNMPWIIGETGYMASEHFGISEGLDGTLNDLNNYIEFVLNGCYRCGGSGFSWWEFQDGYNWPPNTSSFRGNFFGLFDRGMIPGAASEKMPATQTFRDFNGENSTSFCPVDYSENYSSNSLYYNPMGFYNTSNSVSAYVKDQHGNPIKNAVVLVWYRNPNNLSDIPTYYTFTDTDGYFKAIPASASHNIVMIKVSCSSGSSYQSAWQTNNTVPSIPNTITLQNISSEINLNNEIYQSVITYPVEARKSLFLSNIKVEPASIVKFKASVSIELFPGSTIETGCISTFEISPVFYNCSNFSY